MRNFSVKSVMIRVAGFFIASIAGAGTLALPASAENESVKNVKLISDHANCRVVDLSLTHERYECTDVPANFLGDAILLRTETGQSNGKHFKYVVTGAGNYDDFWLTLRGTTGVGSMKKWWPSQKHQVTESCWRQEEWGYVNPILRWDYGSDGWILGIDSGRPDGLLAKLNIDIYYNPNGWGC